MKELQRESNQILGSGPTEATATVYQAMEDHTEEEATEARIRVHNPAIDLYNQL